jgi:hypothetical protein
MFSIGEFSRITGVTIKALRLDHLVPGGRTPRRAFPTAPGLCGLRYDLLPMKCDGDAPSLS